MSTHYTLHKGEVSFGEIVVNFCKTTWSHVSETDIFIVNAVSHSNTEKHLWSRSAFLTDHENIWGH
jgi:hypothetical protein